MRALSMLMVSSFVASAAFASGMLKPGDAFPAWQLSDQNGKTVSSSDFAGRTYLLYFYPKADTPGCTKEGCALRDDYSAYQKAGVEVVGVSFDAPMDNAAFATKYKFPFRLLSDSKHTLAVEVGAADSPSRLWARRISYLIGPKGQVLKAYDNVNPGTHATQVLADAQQLRVAAR